jgi:hypothetical protein
MVADAADGADGIFRSPGLTPDVCEGRAGSKDHQDACNSGCSRFGKVLAVDPATGNFTGARAVLNVFESGAWAVVGWAIRLLDLQRRQAACH